MDGIALTKMAGREVWGYFKNGSVLFEKGKVYSKVIAHEMMHRIYFNFLTREEQIRVLVDLQTKYPELEGQSLHNLIEALSEV